MKQKQPNIFYPFKIITISVLVLSMIFVAQALAELPKDWKPPRLVSIAAISIRSAGFAAGTGLFSTISEKTGVQFRIEPAPTSIDREDRVRSGQVEYARERASCRHYAGERRRVAAGFHVY